MSPFPRVDDHLVLPEVTRDEIIGGRRVVASPAHLPHATQHTRLDYVLEAYVAPGYQAATDLLTRHDEESDFATDACVLKEGRGRAESILDLLEARGVAHRGAASGGLALRGPGSTVPVAAPRRPRLDRRSSPGRTLTSSPRW